MTGTDGGRARFETTLGFAVDPFQADAMNAIDKGHSVLVAAPTGSGKTVVAEYAIECALAGGARAFYTTPLKALSNQKFNDLVARHGAARVGLMTGDTVVRPEADVIVMTTEVLRNMIYARSGSLERLRWVILDEVHYLQNPYRGAVWEEVIIHLPDYVDLVCLSATVSNAEDVADWIATVRGTTEAVIDETRPVELEHLYLAGERDSDRTHLLPTFVDGAPNRAAARLDHQVGREQPGQRRRRRIHTPRRVEVAHVLADAGMLPAVYFIFSRKGCDEAVRQCVNAGLRLTDTTERAQIRALVDAHLGGLSDADLDALGYEHWLTGLEMGVAAHHAGLVPPMKEAVEALFAAALVKLVFATETLSLGINMPARSVVIEKLTKFTGDRHEMLTAGEYTQFTGRAGRRGLDDVGYAVVLWSPFVSFEQVAALASRRTYALRSSFRPTYNMAANLVRRYPPDEARHLLNLSFAQYRADRVIVQEEAAIERLVHDIARARDNSECERGDIAEYRVLVVEAQQAQRTAPTDARFVVDAMHRLRPGDIVVVPSHRTNGRVAVLGPPRGKGAALQLPVVTDDGRRLQLRVKDFALPPRRVGHIKLPTPFEPTASRFLRAAGESVRRAEITEPDELKAYQPKWMGGRSRQQRRTPAQRLADLHAVASCPDAAAHLKALTRAERLERDLGTRRRQRRSDDASLGRQLDRVLGVLGELGFVEGWALTEAGDRLARLYHECDLLIADCLGAGLLDGLSPIELAGLASVFTFESRGADTLVAALPAGLHPRITEIETRHARLRVLERRANLPLTRDIDAGFVGAAYAWANGDALTDVLAEGITGGDFVRNIKQLVDLLRQVGLVAPLPATAHAASEAADLLYRGVIIASSTVGTRDD
ncbi:MAG TPA: DEAD/DEAH box helicase [Acidimicrobiales bacterium]|nr:DEAD/DEAH box helicase [Acidimicrobiales bacterium]